MAKARTALISAALLCAALAPAPVRADPKPRCAVGDICELTFPLFGCKDEKPLRKWVETFVDDGQAAAEAYLTDEEKTGVCVRFNKGDKLRIVRYIGMSRLEATRPDEDKRWLMLLK
jgi:hypothetical protein